MVSNLEKSPMVTNLFTLLDLNEVIQTKTYNTIMLQIISDTKGMIYACQQYLLSQKKFSKMSLAVLLSVVIYDILDQKEKPES